MSIPEMRSFQFGNEAVNLFRGDVDLPLTLFSLPSRNGLDVSIGLLYTSNVHTQVETWNVEAPTGIVGLGWQLPRERIEVDPRGTASLIDNIYYYVSNENRLPLLAATLEWYLFVVGIEYIEYLDKGEIPPSLQEKFAQNALLLSTYSTVQKAPDGLSWQISDPVYERVFTAYKDGEQIKIIDGGQQYELQNYQFWKISYYPDYEKWLFINESGMQFFYGGKVQEQEGRKLSQGNSIEWGVHWGNWLGSSTLEEGQTQYPLSWNLSESASLWGDSVYYTYESVEQRVGEKGLFYTKSCYLSSITDALNKKIIFSYQEKIFDNNTADGTREYLDPHKPTPDNIPNAYQDRYETRFLDKIEIKNAANDLLQFFQFQYEILNVSGLSKSDPLYGNTSKRYLTGIQQFTATGDSLPGLVFDYYVNSDDTHPGALKTITSPSGGTTTYIYEKKGLPLANRSVQINRPLDTPIDTWVPKVWFGLDYAVVTWYNTDTYQLRVSVYTWMGTWYEWQEGKIDVKIKLDLETLNVIANNDFFALSYQESDQDKTGLYLIHKKINALGKWSSSPLYIFNTDRPQFAIGNKFILALDPDQLQLYRYTWQWQNNVWTEASFSLQDFSPLPQAQCRYYLSASNNIFLILAYDIANEEKTNTLSLFYLDEQDKWSAGNTLSVNDIFISSAKEQGNFYWSLGTSFAVGTYLTQNSTRFLQYDVQIFGWDKNYQLYSSYKKENLQIDKPIQFVPAVINNSLVGSGPYLFRYNGKTWQFKDMTLTVPANLQNVFWFAYGEDFALVTENAVGQVISLFSAYDPNQDSIDWKTPVVQLVDEVAPPFRQTRYFPTASGSIFTLDKEIYSRGFDSSWENALKSPIYSMPSNESVDTTTLVNGAPGFLTYLEYEGDYNPKETHVLTIKNGQARSALTTPNQLFQIYNDQGYPKLSLSGKYPAGPSSFYTFPTTNTLNDTPYITLHRYLIDEIAGEINDYRVKTIATYDGFETRYACYQYDDQTAVPDPSGLVIKYYRVCVYHGCASPEEAQEGYVETIYINGLPANIAGIHHSLLSAYNNSQDNYSILDGFLDVKNTYDNQGKLIAAEKNDWFIKTTISIDNQEYPIQGYYALLKQVTSSFEGITTAALTDYDFSSGQIIRRETSNYNAQGNLETWVETTVYGYQEYPTLRHLNTLPVVIQSKTEVQGENNAISKLYITRLKAWLGPQAVDTQFPLSIYAIYDNFQWKGGVEQDTNFVTWDTNTLPSSDWKGGSKIISRATNGLALETEEVMGRYASTLYDSHYHYPVASFTHAQLSLNQADYLGFEDYEAGSGWTMVPSGAAWRSYVTNETANTGRCALKLSASTTAQNRLRRVIKPTKEKSYLLTTWYKTAENFLEEEEKARWLLTIFDAGKEVSRLSYPLIATQSEWSYSSYVLNLEAYQNSDTVEIVIEVYNDTNADVYLDNIRCSPFLGSFSANVYDTRYDLQLASIGPNKEIERSGYNNLWQTAIDVGPDENVNKFCFQYYARQFNAVFDPLKPNASMNVTGMEKGFYSDFQRDGGYQKHWATAHPEAWKVEQGQLHYQGDNESVIALNVPELTECYAAYLLVSPQESVTQPLGINIGEALTVRWFPTQNEWVVNLLDDKQQYSVKTHQTEVAKEWVVYCYDQVFLFFADGEKIFSVMAQQPIKGGLQLFTANKMAFYNITVCSQPQLVITYLDGWDKGRQSQMLFEAASVVNEIVYDDMGRAVIQTKAACLPPTDAIPLLDFRPDFVKSIDWQSGIMQGEISDYYGPQGKGFSDDEGYPYTRTLYERSPLERPVESGLSGKAFAIIHPYTTEPSSRKTAKIRYGANQSTDPMHWLPENQYFVTTTIDADGNTAFSVSDQSRNTIGGGALIDKENNRYTLTTYQSAYTNVGKKVTTFLPNYYHPPQEEYKDQWQATTQYNMLDQAVVSDSPNAGVTETIYDIEGKVRFAQDARGRADNYYLYLKYDTLNRVIEDGRIDGSWNQSQLQYYADSDPSWPLNATTWGKKMIYDGDGSNPNLISRLAAVKVRDEVALDKIATVEYFSYDIQGNVTQHTLDMLAENRSYTTDYTYNNQNKVVSISYPATQEQDRLEVCYFYSEGGLIKSVGNSKEQPEYYASYRYNADGSLYKEIFNTPTDSIERLYSYTSPGWLQEIADPYYQQKMYYTQGPQGTPGYYTGLVAEEIFAFQGAFPQPLTQNYSYRYEYDCLSQLIKAENKTGTTINPKWSIGLDEQATRYDDNGNILQIRQAEQTREYTYIPGTDKVKNTQANANDDYTYDPTGNMVSAKPKSITNIVYNKTTQCTESMAIETDKLNFIYDSNSRRIAKKTSNSAKFYNYGLSANPLSEMTQTNDAAESTTHYIHGANGLLGFKKDAVFYSILQDRLGSSRVLLNEDLIVAAYTYLPFGDFMDDPQQLAALSYYYTGQELDKEIALYNYKARFYDPSLGRFYSTDAAGQFASPYIYGANNPIMFIDPSGNISIGAILGIVGGGLAIIGGIGISVASFGILTPAGITLSLTGATAIGAGLASVTYSALNADNWSAKEWGINVGIGGVMGLISAGAGSLIGAGINVSAQTMATVGRQAAIRIGLSIIAGGAEGAATNFVTTAVSNAALGTNQSLVAAAWQGALIGAVTGGVGGVGGVKGAVRKASNYRFAPGAKAQVDAMPYYPSPPGGLPSRQGLTGILKIRDQEFSLGDYSSVGNGPYAPAHLQMALRNPGPVLGRRFVNGGDGWRADYPHLRGFAIRRRADDSIEVGFASRSLNQGRAGSQLPQRRGVHADRFMSQNDNFQLLLATRYELGIRPYTDTAMLVPETAFANFLRSPFS